MTKSKRIILNTLASYGRSVFALFVGVFSSRWLLQGLGEEDMGLQGVVGSLIGAIIILETVMQVAVARFYAYAIGWAQKMDEASGADEICRWFNVVFLIHTVLPLLVVVVGYPLGVYAVQNWLVIPVDRLDACEYVFRCSMLAAFVSMISVPYISMYTAKQMIVELSVFGILRSVATFALTFSLLYVTCDRLKYIGVFTAAISIVILGLQMWRARLHFSECRVRMDYLFDLTRIRQIFSYFFWEMFSCVGNMTRHQGSALVINKCFDPSVNAAWSIANSLSGQAAALSGAMVGAFLPAVTTEEGAGEREGMIALSFRTCKFGTLLILAFSIPLVAEMDEVLRLWLVTPPAHTAQLCICVLISYVIDKLGLGHHAAISAKGKIGVYHCVVGSTFFLSIPIAIALVVAGFGVASIGLMFIVCFSLVSMERVVFARYLIGMPIGRYLKGIVMPLILVSGVSYVVAACIANLIPPSFLRVGITTSLSLFVMSILCWLVVFDDMEKQYLIDGVRRLACRLQRRNNHLK